jgi:hypothetical protein
MVTNHDTWVVGYTLRLGVSNALATAWDSARKARYLLRPEIPFALGFDDVVWPQCDVDIGMGKLLGESLATLLNDNGCGFFDELATLTSSFDPSDISQLPRGCALVAAISPRSRESMAIPTPELRDRYRSALAKLPYFDQWSRLGFDIVESALGISGLSNTGYTEADLVALKPRYAALLNSFGLVDGIEAAIDLSHETTARVKEHAPFVPVSLFTFGKLTSS